MICKNCSYDDNGTGDFTHACHPYWPMLSDGHLRAICFAYEKGFAAGVNEYNTTNVFGASGSQAAAFDFGLECGRAAQSRVQPAPSVPDGWQLVPIDPTPDIESAIRVNLLYESCTPAQVWHAALAAAPKPEGE